ncbi:MAG: sugar phosphate isomerase/epimerase family protein [Candidatus Bipolaricaulaceae bacterium]
MDRHRLGLSAFLRPGFDLAAWISLAEQLCLGWIEVRAEPGLAYAGDLDRAARGRARRALADAGLRASLHAPIHDLNLASPNVRAAAVALGELVDAVDLAADLGAELVVFHPGGVPREYVGLPGAYEGAWRRLEYALEVALPRAARRGVRLALENKQRGRGRDLVITGPEHRRALDRFESLWACLDLGHLHTVGGDVAAHLEALGDRLAHVHLHDNHGERDEHLGLGQGTVPWRQGLAALAGAGYAGPVVLEIPNPDQLRAGVEAVAGHGAG